MDIKMLVERDQQKYLRWSLGTCSSGNSDVKYEAAAQYKERCCLTPGEHILLCHTSDYSLGWKHAQIRINGHSYCDDYISLKAMRKITIHSMGDYQSHVSMTYIVYKRTILRRLCNYYRSNTASFIIFIIYSASPLRC